MAIKQFDPGLSPSHEDGSRVLSEYLEATRNAEPWFCEYQTKAILPYELETVWRVLLESEQYHLWLDRYGRTGDIHLPARFGRGHKIDNDWDKGLGPSYVLDCTPPGGYEPASLTIARPFYDDAPPYYFTFTVTPYERYSTSFTLHGCNSRKQTTVQRMFGGAFRKPVPGAFHIELTDRLNTAIRNFINLCSDRTQFGPALDGWNSYRKVKWFTWPSATGRINYYPNRKGATSPQVGEPIKHSERIGFVVPDGGGTNLEECKERFYVAPGEGVVRQILKMHGDHVQHEERIMLLSEAPDTDLQQTVLRMQDMQMVPRNKFYRARLVKYLIQEGQPIAQGDTVALFEDSDKKTQFELRSSHVGLAIQHRLKLGQEVTDSDPVIAIRIPPLTT